MKNTGKKIYTLSMFGVISLLIIGVINICVSNRNIVSAQIKLLLFSAVLLVVLAVIMLNIAYNYSLTRNDLYQMYKTILETEFTKIVKGLEGIKVGINNTGYYLLIETIKYIYLAVEYKLSYIKYRYGKQEKEKVIDIENIKLKIDYIDKEVSKVLRNKEYNYIDTSVLNKYEDSNQVIRYKVSHLLKSFEDKPSTRYNAVITPSYSVGNLRSGVIDIESQKGDIKTTNDGYLTYKTAYGIGDMDYYVPNYKRVRYITNMDVNQYLYDLIREYYIGIQHTKNELITRYNKLVVEDMGWDNRRVQDLNNYKKNDKIVEGIREELPKSEQKELGKYLIESIIIKGNNLTKTYRAICSENDIVVDKDHILYEYTVAGQKDYKERLKSIGKYTNNDEVLLYNLEEDKLVYSNEDADLNDGEILLISNRITGIKEVLHDSSRTYRYNYYEVEVDNTITIKVQTTTEMYEYIKGNLSDGRIKTALGNTQLYVTDESIERNNKDQNGNKYIGNLVKNDDIEEELRRIKLIIMGLDSLF